MNQPKRCDTNTCRLGKAALKRERAHYVGAFLLTQSFQICGPKLNGRRKVPSKRNRGIRFKCTLMFRENRENSVPLVQSCSGPVPTPFTYMYVLLGNSLTCWNFCEKEGAQWLSD